MLRFAVVMPGTDGAGTSTTIRSLRDQTYPHWTLVVPETGSDETGAFDPAAELGTDRVVRSAGRYVALPGGPDLYVLPLLPGDELADDALANLALAATADPAPDLIYGDHAERFGQTSARTPFFKPSWSPEFLVATDYVGRAAVRADRLGPNSLPAVYDAIDLWALWLEASLEDDLRVERVEQVVMSIADTPADPDTIERARAVVDAHLAARGIVGRAVRPAWAQRLAVVAFDVEFPDEGPSVAVLIPTRNNLRVLRRCVDSLALTTYRNVEFVIIDNASDDPATVEYLRGLPHKVLRIPSPPTGFSYSYVNNEAARRVEADHLVFLNDDTEVIAGGWLSQMVGWAAFPGVASVGARLLFPDDRVQHAGLVHKLLDGVLPAPTFKLTPRRTIGPHAQDRTVRNYSAVTAACMLTPRRLFLDEGGFDDVDFSVAYNDCDYGFRLTRKGLRHVYVPTAELYHHEGATRGRGQGNDKISEEVAFIRRYHDWNDPYYNRNLSRESLCFEAGRRVAVVPGLRADHVSVAVFTHNLNYEGAPLVLLEIARGLRRLGRGDVTVFSLVDGPLRAVFEAEGCDVVVRPDLDLFGARSEAVFDERLQPIVDRMQLAGADVVVANTILCHWGMRAARLAKLPAISIIHESEPPFAHLAPHGDHHVAIARRAFEEAYMNVFVAKATRDLYEPMRRRANLTVVYNGFDAERASAAFATFDREAERRRLGVGASELLCLMPGIVCERKAQIDLVQAISDLPDRISAQCRFVIVGDRDGDYSRELHRRADSLPAGKRERLTIVRETHEIWRFFQAADVLVFTSHLESFPRVIQEAMYCGLAIVSTSVFGISEQLRDNQSGLLYSPGDVGALCRALERVVEDPALRERLGNVARVALDRFPTLPEMQEQYWNLVVEAYFSAGKSVAGGASASWLADDAKAGTDVWWEQLRHA